MSEYLMPTVGTKIGRVNVVGTSGSGKSTFAKRLARAAGLPYVEMDKIFWGPGWAMPTDEVFFPKLRKALESEGWVLDGNYTRTIPIKWEKVDLVVWLDYSFPRTLFQAVKRAVARALSGEELWEGTGNRESFRQSFFSKKSILWWTITTHGKVRGKYENYLADERFRHIRFVRLRKPADAENFLAEMERKKWIY